MRRNVATAATMLIGLIAPGCGLPGWYRAVGSIPGVAASDYAFYNFCGTSSQVFQFPVPQVEGATIEALRDLGFTEQHPAERRGHEARAMTARAPDGRTATITLTPQNGMTNARITFGPAHVGDERLSRDVLRRVALNFGTLPRDYMPVEPVLARRLNHRGPASPPQTGGEPPVTLEGEGLRPGQDHNARPTPEFTAPITGEGSGVIPPPFDPSRPYYPGQVVEPGPYNPYGPSYFGGGQFPL
ncbi:hypothetical protein OJF2_44080 [Aquisphaera giovannonii]|uniref:Uncharacterized protein n=1 Tax=Aquisphaera giovannonii TaxID=406548 RepID=A0A5B9W758_9BACT|nr:hypothetical protein [Aquisphaera giovannonii]QEH35851.1 hypothetical protein OJF2_44080 [Aquisphaera giovannonii]